MRIRPPWNYVPPPGPVLSAALVGMVLLSGLLYYRAVKIQRFLEPALALSQPRNEFAEAIQQAVQKEFGKGQLPGLDVRTSSILLDQALIVSGDGRLHPLGKAVLHRFARVFLSLLEDRRTRGDISLVLISAGYVPDRPAGDAAERLKVQRMLGMVQDELVRGEPALAVYRAFFAVTARPAPPRAGYRELMEFRVIPSEMLHMEFLQRIQKYAQ